MALLRMVVRSQQRILLLVQPLLLDLDQPATAGKEPAEIGVADGHVLAHKTQPAADGARSAAGPLSVRYSRHIRLR